MPRVSETRYRALARACVQDMGDIFWDYQPDRDRAGGYTDPRRIAVQAVEKCLRSLESAWPLQSSKHGHPATKQRRR